MPQFDSEKLQSKYHTMVEKLYNEHKSMMFCIAMDIVKNKEHASDIVHSSFESIMKHMTKLSAMSEKEVKGFVVLTAKNKSIDFLKLHENKKTVPLEPFIECLPCKYGSAEKEAIINIEINDIMMLLEKLESRYAIPVFYKYVLGYSMTEVAELLGLTVANAKVRCCRGRNMLLKLMRSGEPNE